MRTWIKGKNFNRCSVEYWGSEEKAREMLKATEEANNYSCSDCSDCSDCSGCSYCLGCSRCSGLKENAPVAMPPVPIIPNIHKAVYAAVTATPDSLNMADWHSCDTTHCRGGWVVHLAGEAGKKLEQATSTLFAAQQIYKASGHSISPVRFFDNNEDAMADMKKLAEQEPTP